MKSHTSGNKAQTMVVAWVNAISQAIPPYVCQNFKSRMDTKYAHSENGWIDIDLFEYWFNNHFLTHAVSSRPLLWAQDTLSASRLPGSKKMRSDNLLSFPQSMHVSQPLYSSQSGIRLHLCFNQKALGYRSQNIIFQGY